MDPSPRRRHLATRGLLAAGLLVAAAWIWPRAHRPAPAPIDRGPQLIEKEPLSRRERHYRILAALDPESRILRGRQSLQIRNVSRFPIKTVEFHLYLNAFSSYQSNFMRKNGGSMRFVRFDPNDPGWILVRDLRSEGRFLKSRLLHDGTTLQVELDRPLPPEGHRILSMSFMARLPRIFARTGHAGSFFMLAQFYPKAGFLLPDGRWHCPPYDANSEYFAPFALYDMTIELPIDYKVAAGGLHLEDEIHGTSRRHRIRAVDVHDLALAVWPAFEAVEREVQGVRVALATVAGRGNEARIFDGVESGLARLTDWFGPYPYRKLTVVDVPLRAFGASAMEYPTLFTVIVPRWAPSFFRVPDLMVVHELTHQYFQGLVATNEVLEPWLDEGLTTYVSGLIADGMFGEDRSILDLGSLALGDHEQRWLTQVGRGTPLPVAQQAAAFPTFGAYARTVYSRATLLLATLEDLMGRKAMLSALHHYYKTYRFRHPTGADLEGILLAAMPADRRPIARLLVDGVLRGGGVPDYSLRCATDQVTVVRRGDIRLPLTLRLETQRGEHLLALDGKAPEHRVDVPGLTGAILGPPRRLGLDPTPGDLACRVASSEGPRAAAFQLLPLIQVLLQAVGP